MDREPKVGEVWKWNSPYTLPPFRILEINGDSFSQIKIGYLDGELGEGSHRLSFLLDNATYIPAYSTPLYKLLNS